MTTFNPVLSEHGHFWWANLRPGDKKEVVTGQLTISADGISRLELDGVLRSLAHPFEILTQGPSRSIAGALKHSRHEVLLLDASPNGGHAKGEFSFERFVSYSCLVGDSVPPLRATGPRFLKVSIPLDGFEQWLWAQSLKVIRTQRQLRISWKSSPDLKFKTEFGQVTISQSPKITQNEYIPTYDVGLREYAEISLRPKRAISAEEIGSLFNRLQDLMILLTGSSRSLGWPKVKLFRQKRICTYYFPRHISSADPPRAHETPVNFPHLKTRFGSVLSAWKNKLDEYGPGFYSYIATKRDTTLIVESRFSMLAQGLEAFHRTKYGDAGGATDVQEKIDRVLGQISDKDDKEWLGLQLKPTPTLKQRITELLLGLPLDLKGSRVKNFSYHVSSLRNDLAHYGGDRTRKEGIKYTRKLHAYCEAISPLYHALLLREIGVPDEIINRWIYKSLRSGTIQYWLIEVGLIPKKPAANAPQGAYAI